MTESRCWDCDKKLGVVAVAGTGVYEQKCRWCGAVNRIALDRPAETVVRYATSQVK